MGRMYTVSFDAVAVTAAQDLFELTAAAEKPIKIHRIELFQTTDLGDAQEEVLRIRIRQGQTTSGSGGSAPSVVPNDVDDAAAGCAAEANNTTQASAGTIVVNDLFGWNIRVPLTRYYTPEGRPKCKGSRRLTIELIAAPADSVTISGLVEFEEGP